MFDPCHTTQHQLCANEGALTCLTLVHTCCCCHPYQLYAKEERLFANLHSKLSGIMDRVEDAREQAATALPPADYEELLSERMGGPEDFGFLFGFPFPSPTHIVWPEQTSFWGSKPNLSCS